MLCDADLKTTTSDKPITVNKHIPTVAKKLLPVKIYFIFGKQRNFWIIYLENIKRYRIFGVRLINNPILRYDIENKFFYLKKVPYLWVSITI